MGRVPAQIYAITQQVEAERTLALEELSGCLVERFIG